jgi:hypothetical protein
MSFRSWTSPSTVRHYPLTPAQHPQPLRIEAALNEQFSFQVVMRMEDEEAQNVKVSVEGPPDWSLRLRRVGYVPLLHHNTPVGPNALDVEGLGHVPGYVPDPLFDEETLFLPNAETHAFWITARPGGDAMPGDHAITVIISPERDDEVRHTIQVHLYDVALEKRHDFAITHWFYVDALIDWYKTDLFDARFWDILSKYVQDVVAHGQDTLLVPVFTPSTDGVKRPSQLLRVERTGPDAYSFDWRDVARYIRLARQSGITHYEWCHFFTQWGAKHAIRIYEGQGRDEKLLWSPETSATSDTYRAFLSQYLPALHRFLVQEDILNSSFFHVSDEPHGEEALQQYRLDRAIIGELAPWIKVMDALSEIAFARQGLLDMPAASIRTALDFVREDIPCWCYYCCGPRGEYLNRLLDTPLAKIAMHGLLFYRWPFHGFLHWGYNYWYQSQIRRLIDPSTVQDGLRWQTGWAYGDTFEVYPGPEGPVDSMRWEVFGESLQDYALLQTLGVDRDDPLLEPLASFSEFPKTAGWRRNLHSVLLKRGR